MSGPDTCEPRGAHLLSPTTAPREGLMVGRSSAGGHSAAVLHVFFLSILSVNLAPSSQKWENSPVL